MDNDESTVAVSPLLTFLEKLHDTLLFSVENIVFDKRDFTERYLIMLHASMIELAGSCIALFQKKIVSAIPSIMRNMLENIANSKNLTSDPEYSYSMRLKNAKTQLEILRGAKEGKNKFLKDIAAYPQLDQRIGEYENKFPELKQRKFRVSSVRDVFEKAEMLDEFVSIYALFSSGPHSGLHELSKRHIAYEEKDFSLVLYKPPLPEELALDFFGVSQLLIDSALLAHNFFKSSDYEKVKDLQKELEMLIAKIFVEIFNNTGE